MYFRRFSLIGIVVLLASCTANERSALPPEEVLLKAAQAGRELETARYTVTGDYALRRDAWRSQGEFRMEGQLAGFGEQVQFTLDVDASLDDPKQSEHSTIDGTIEFLQTGPREVYLYLHSLAVDPSVGILRPDRIADFAGQWWLLPPPEVSGEGMTVTPEPHLLEAQSEVIRVVKDRSFTAVSGRDAYLYDVEVIPEKLAAFLAERARERGEEPDMDLIREFAQKLRAKGSIVIDAESFAVLAFSWNIEELPLPFDASSRVSVRVDMRDHNGRIVVTPPEKPLLFSPMIFLDLPPRVEEGMLAPADRNDLLRELLEKPTTLPATN